MLESPLIFQACLGILVFFIFPVALSENRRRIDYKFVVLGLAVQIFLAVVITKIAFVQSSFLWVSEGINKLKCATCEGTKFVFGYLGGGDVPFLMKEGASPFIFAFQPLPMVMVVSAISMLLFHWRILPIIVRGFSWALRKTLNIGGALGVCAAAKVFLGQTEAPLLIRPYLSQFTRSELFTVMTAGMATTSASIMILYGQILENTIQNPISHILTASIISIPAAITISRIMIPQTGEDTSGELVLPYHFSGAMDAVSQGASDGMKLFLNIIAMLIVALALVAIANYILGTFPDFNNEAVTLQRLLGFFMAPVTWLMGIPWEEAKAAGNLLGTKTILNEVVAFIDLSNLKSALSPHTNLIMTYALCGFANLSSIGIQIGGLGTMVPERRAEIISLGFRALIAGTIASCLSGTIMGLLFWMN
ncbi:nucleoside permease NupX [Caedimonas varicaedens]|jgi:CNT family concentrative nucleoside transporter|uniref:Nucleoside permease NupX n=1 Tax=Caedimonas varicaedens TaxID=1629334 RepID=A0A0K8MCY5_9PROT|nr:nucleoside permease NupX [Caedimonas varicaedens]